MPVLARNISRRARRKAAGCLVAVAVAALALPVRSNAAGAEPGTRLAFPAYTAEHVLAGLYRHRLPARARAFEAQARELGAVLRERCLQPEATDAIRRQWLQALRSWQALATPAIGPVLARRSQRQIDFWPTRPPLIERALRQAPKTLADMERVGTPAKGFPAIEWLLQQPLDPARCAYLDLVGQGIVAEAQALSSELLALAGSEGRPVGEKGGEQHATRNEAVGERFQEWVNQWLGGWERLRWMHIEQPLQKARTTEREPRFARLDFAANLADWRAQWQALREQARLAAAAAHAHVQASATATAIPPVPGEALIPIEALLIGKGHIALAERWVQALDKVDSGMDALQPQSEAGQLQTLADDMKSVTVLFRNEVAAALDVPLGFSDADGD